MKKMMFTFFIILFLPLNILAYSKYVIPGGESIGIKINTEGLVVVGFYEVDNEFIAKKNIKIGDKIIKINNINVNSIEELSNLIESNIKNNIINVQIKRNNKIIDTSIELKKENNVYKTGIYVKDSIIGLGTLTYIDPLSKTYGALGHEIIFDDTNERVGIKDGSIFMSKITSISKSRNGLVGSKNANIVFNNKIGSILKNTSYGLFGKYNYIMPEKELLEAIDYNDIKLGKAFIYTVVEDDIINKYEINILDKYDSKKNTQKAFSFEIVDKKLISNTGGIVQGMSGSPIIQDNKLIGAVTNVLVDDVKFGYGISIITMLEEGEKK